MNLFTENLTIRPITLDDLNNVHNLFLDERTRKYLITTNIHDIEYTKSIILRIIDYGKKERPNIYRLVITSKINNGFIGIVDVRFDNDFSLCVLGFTRNHEAPRIGYMHESVSAVIKYIFDKFLVNTIQSSCYEHNKDSIRFMEKLGYKCVKTIENSLPPVDGNGTKLTFIISKTVQ